ncbi:alpha/beta hydrolase [Streptomyces sp. NPDC051578]|uniref:alpha/beta hydrolase n=1 Tax=Streptomyces sp. NPDC051578 TaxID=3365662 RepID=UPI0037909DC6
MTITDQDCLRETLAFNDHFAAARADRPAREGTPGTAALTLLRRNRLGGDAPPTRLPQGRDRVIDGAGTVRAFVPDHIDGVYPHIHGGGWAFGSADGQDERLWRLADQARLAVVTLLRLRDRHGITGAFRAAHLLFGAYDLSMTPSQRSFGNRRLLSNTESLRGVYELFTPGVGEEERRSPEVSPLFADLTELPPARIVVGTEDPLLDDSLFLAACWQAAGAPVRLGVIAGAMHGFTLFPLTITERELRRERDFLATAWR